MAKVVARILALGIISYFFFGLTGVTVFAAIVLVVNWGD